MLAFAAAGFESAGALFRQNFWAAATPLPGSIFTHIQHRHLGSGDGSQQHQLVQVAQVSDPEQLAGNLGESRTEREIVAFEGSRDDFGAVDAAGIMMADTVSEYHFDSVEHSFKCQP
jgi:hypothetical protein